MVAFQVRQDSARQPARDPLRDLGVGWIPGFGLWLDRERNAWFMRCAEFLQPANIDLSNQLQASFRGFLDILSEHVPVIKERRDGEPADRSVYACEQAWGKAFAVPLVAADGPNDVFAWGNRHGYDESRSTSPCKSPCANAPSSPVASR